MAVYYIGGGNSGHPHFPDGVERRILGADDAGRDHDMAGAEDSGLVSAVNELPYVIVGRIGAHFLRRSHLDQPSVPHDGDGIAQLKGFVDIMGNKNDGFFQLSLEGKQLELHVFAHQGIQGREGLIH